MEPWKLSLKNARPAISSVSRSISTDMSKPRSVGKRSAAIFADSTIKPKWEAMAAGVNIGCISLRFRFQASPSAVTRPFPKTLRK